MNNSVFSAFTPKENKFFPLLVSLADVVNEVSIKFYELIKKKNEGIDVKYDYEGIKKLETQGDEITTNIINELSRTFITPFDREDIHDLANNLDDVIDEINSCAKKIFLYNPKKLTGEALETAHLIKQSAELISSAMEGLSSFRANSKKISQVCKDLHELENRGDDCYAQFITNIFKDESDVVEIIKLKDIMSELENTTDCTDHVGKTLRTIIVKYV